MNDKGEIIDQKKLPSNGEIVDSLNEFSEEMEVAIEATPSWYWLYDYLEDEGFQVSLSRPLKTKALAYDKARTDRVDSAALAHLPRTNLFQLSYVPEKGTRLNRQLLFGKKGMTFSHFLSFSSVSSPPEIHGLREPLQPYYPLQRVHIS